MRLAKELFEIIEDQYKAIDIEHKKMFGYGINSKKTLLKNYSKGCNLVQRDAAGRVEGFLNYLDHGDWFDFKTIAIRKDLRGTYKGSKLMLHLFNGMIKIANDRGIRYIDLVLLTLENTISNMAEKVGFEFMEKMDRNQILTRKVL